MPEWKQEVRRRLAKMKIEPVREAAIVEEKCKSEAADIHRRIEALNKLLLPHLNKLGPETALDIAERWERVVNSTQEILRAFRDRARSAFSEAAE